MAAMSKWKQTALEERKRKNAIARKNREAKPMEAVKGAGWGAVGAGALGYANGMRGSDTLFDVDSRPVAAAGLIGAGVAAGSPMLIQMGGGCLSSFAYDKGFEMASAAPATDG